MAELSVILPEELNKELLTLPGWEIKDTRLCRLFQFKTFQNAIDFVNQVAQLAESENHHPDIEVLFNMVWIKYWTHTADGVTEKDLISVRKINEINF